LAVFFQERLRRLKLLWLDDRFGRRDPVAGVVQLIGVAVEGPRLGRVADYCILLQEAAADRVVRPGPQVKLAREPVLLLAGEAVAATAEITELSM
jgi:hypothetical protein